VTNALREPMGWDSVQGGRMAWDAEGAVGDARPTADHVKRLESVRL
jgi:hypothetical protein